MLTYHPRQVHRFAPVDVDGLQLKRYELRCQEAFAKPPLTEPQWHSLLSGCAGMLEDPREHKVGFAMFHRAADGDYLLVSRWYGGNMLKHEAFTLVPMNQGWRKDSLKDTLIVACVWELEIMAFERDAWVRTSMSQDSAEATHFADYMQTSFAGWV